MKIYYSMRLHAKGCVGEYYIPGAESAVMTKARSMIPRGDSSPTLEWEVGVRGEYMEIGVQGMSVKSRGDRRSYMSIAKANIADRHYLCMQ
jgi:hypothetical protein